jgi:hypothetical protein
MATPLMETNGLVVRTQLAAHLVIFTCEGRQGDDVALDIIEYIALRTDDRDDASVLDLGIYVRSVLLSYVSGDMRFCDALDCFEAAAMAAPSGKSALFEVLSFTKH